MRIYIKSIQSISPQNSFLQPSLPSELINYRGFMTAILPDMKAYYSPMKLRRMSRILRMGSACSIETLKEAEVDVPDSILIGTGLGCVADTEKFLNQMLDTNEGLLNPTAFIQSTHNTVAAKIALDTKCHGYNMVYAHKTISFENALIDAILSLKDNEAEDVLVGGIDELTQENYNLKVRQGLFRSGECKNSQLLEMKSSGLFAGDGTTFALISQEMGANTVAEIKFVDVFYAPDSMDTLEHRAKSLLSKEGLSFDDIDVVISGINGHLEGDKTYNDLVERCFPEANHAYYKHLCGEFDTASAFSLWMAERVIREKAIPEYALISKKERPVKNVLLYNKDGFKNHSFMLVTSV